MSEIREIEERLHKMLDLIKLMKLVHENRRYLLHSEMVILQDAMKPGVSTDYKELHNYINCQIETNKILSRCFKGKGIQTQM